MTMHTINVSKVFSTTPGGRFYTDGPYSGQRFREEFLAPAIEANDIVVVDLNGAYGFGSSFLDEAFGGMIRKKKVSAEVLMKKLRIETPIQLYRNKVLKYITEARPE